MTIQDFVPLALRCFPGQTGVDAGLYSTWNTHTLLASLPCVWSSPPPSCDLEAFNLWPPGPILTLVWLFQGSRLPLAQALRTFLGSVARRASLSHCWPPLWPGLPLIFYTHTSTRTGVYKRSPAHKYTREPPLRLQRPGRGSTWGLLVCLWAVGHPVCLTTDAGLTEADVQHLHSAELVSAHMIATLTSSWCIFCKFSYMFLDKKVKAFNKCKHCVGNLTLSDRTTPQFIVFSTVPSVKSHLCSTTVFMFVMVKGSLRLQT